MQQKYKDDAIMRDDVYMKPQKHSITSNNLRSPTTSNINHQQFSIQLLVTILTTNNIEYLKRAVNSVQNQYKCNNLEYEIKIIVNSLQKDYFETVLKSFPTIDVIDSISNGYAGKGHNMCLNVFEANKKFNYLTVLDGDDLLYPVAFQRFCAYIERFNFDILHLMVNDTIKLYNNSSDNNFPNYTRLLEDNFYLFSTFDNFDNHWQSSAIICENPFKSTSLLNIKTPSRIVLTNRNIFKTDIHYNEKLKVHDDLLAFCHLYEAQHQHIINSIVSSDSYIYVYNGMNNDSISKKSFEDTKSIFEEFKQLQLVLHNPNNHFKYVFEWKLDQLPFVIIDPPTNYSTLDKIDYCNTEIVQFELKQIQQQIQEYLRVYSLNKRTMTTQNQQIIKNKIINYVSRYFHNYGVTQRNPLESCYNILIELNCKKFAYIVLKSLYEKYPFICYLQSLFKITYELQKYDQCKYYYRILSVHNQYHLNESTSLILSKNDDKLCANNGSSTDHKSCYGISGIDDTNNGISGIDATNNDNIHHIYKMMCQNIHNVKFNKIINRNKPIICIHIGYLNVDYNGQNYQEKPVYGNEIMTIQLCEQLADDFNVIVLSTGIIKFNKYNGVIYANVNDFVIFNRHFIIDYFIICRFIGCILDLDLSKIKHIYLVIHDSIPNYLWKFHENYLPNKGFQLFENFENRIEKIVCMSKWQRGNLIRFIQQNHSKYAEKQNINDSYDDNDDKNTRERQNNDNNDDKNTRERNNRYDNNDNKIMKDKIYEKITIIPNAIHINSYNSYAIHQKNSNRFIYCSSPQRGLNELCDILSELRKYMPDVFLDVYYGVNQQIINHYKKYKWVTFHGKITQNQLKNELLTTDFWVYPINDQHSESFCLTCLEAMAARNVIIVSNNSAINELICVDILSNNNETDNIIANKPIINGIASNNQNNDNIITNNTIINGILIPKFQNSRDQIQWIVNEIIKINSSNELKQQYQENAYQYAKLYDWHIIKKKWMSIF